jgi:hypothetical protein
VDAELWFAEYNATCVEYEKAAGRMGGINVVVGDQADKETLKSWVKTTGGNFNAIIDDGGHRNEQIIRSFYALWPTLNAGGYYFIEDIQVGFVVPFGNEGVPPTVRLMNAFTEILSTQSRTRNTTVKNDAWPLKFDHHHKHLKGILSRYPFPVGLDMVACQYEACVLHKTAL